jgi:hypothetical protein
METGQYMRKLLQIQGVRHFPRSSSDPLQEQPLKTKRLANNMDSTQNGQLHQCQACSLCENGSFRFKWKPFLEPDFKGVNYLFLFDYPDSETPSGVPKILANLSQKLEAHQSIGFSSLIRCVPASGPSELSWRKCTPWTLMEWAEIVKRNPIRGIFAFGWGSLAPLLAGNGVTPQEEGMSSKQNLAPYFWNQGDGNSIPIWLLPSATELEKFPKWRKPVWDLLLNRMSS